MLVNIVTLVYINQTHKRHRDFSLYNDIQIIPIRRSGLLMYIMYCTKNEGICNNSYYNEQMMRPVAEFMNVHFLGIILGVIRLETSFKPLLLRGGGGGGIR
jgi:hypothetical protein